jgi:hypothetical protein
MPPWHYTTPLDLLDHWQTLIAGGLALLAAGLTVWVTMSIERRKAKREMVAFRKSLAVELRQLIPRALSAYGSLQRLGSKRAARSRRGWSRPSPRRAPR